MKTSGLDVLNLGPWTGWEPGAPDSVCQPTRARTFFRGEVHSDLQTLSPPRAEAHWEAPMWLITNVPLPPPPPRTHRDAPPSRFPSVVVFYASEL